MSGEWVIDYDDIQVMKRREMMWRLILFHVFPGVHGLVDFETRFSPNQNINNKSINIHDFNAAPIVNSNLLYSLLSMLIPA